MSKDPSNFGTSETKGAEAGERITWKKSFEFVLNVVGYNVGIGNVWRFAYLCYKDGGGAFLIPYLVIAVFCGLPLLFQELAMGQFTRKGNIGAWDFCPIMRGIGYSSLFLALYFLLYVEVVMGWCIFYLAHSFTLDSLPWSTCGNWWNTADCTPVIPWNASMGNISHNATLDDISSTREFWNHYVLQKTDGIHDIGSFTNWRMVLCYLAAWIICYMCIVKGIRTTGKVAYVTVTLPYVMMVILLVRGLTLKGAITGIKFYFTPNLARLADPGVWLDAGSQVLFSLGVCYSVLCSLGSYNKFNYDCYKKSFLFVVICCGSSVFVGFVVFCFIGHMAHEQGKNISDVAEGGPGLVFEVYPAAVSLLPYPQIWSITFFLMMVFITVDSVFGTLEGCLTSIADIWRGRPERLRVGVCFILMILALPQLSGGGIYLFELVNNYGASGICIMMVAFFQSITIAWVYGVERFFDDVKRMIGYYPHMYFKYCYLYITPFMTMSIFVSFCVKYSPLTLGNYTYPWWGDMIGWMLSLSVIMCIPTVFVRTLYTAKGNFVQRWKRGSTPTLDHGSLEKFKSDDEAAVSIL